MADLELTGNVVTRTDSDGSTAAVSVSGSVASGSPVTGQISETGATVSGGISNAGATIVGQIVTGAPGRDGDGAGGIGDMTKSVYDPSSINADAFDVDNHVSGTSNKVYTAAEQTKLSGVATGATANSTDATLLARSNHTGSQAIATVTGLQTALDGKASSIHAHAIADVTSLQTTLDAKATQADIDASIASLVDTAPGTLDTLNELAAALGDDPNFATTVTDSIATKTTGPALSTDNTLPRFDGTTGKLLQSSGVTIDDSNNLTSGGTIESTTLMGAPAIGVDTVTEYFLDNGVLIEGVLLKDSLVDGRDIVNDGAKLDTIESGAQVNTVSSVNTRTGAVTISEADVLPPQTGNGGKFLTTDGMASSWASLAGGGDMASATYDPTGIAGDAFARANHTGTQTAATISDFDTEVANNSAVAANTAKRSYPSADETKLAGIEAGAEVNDVTSVAGATGAVSASTIATEVGKLLFPVGSYYINETNSTNPATLLGFGTWEAVQDKFVYGAGTKTAGTTGGSESVTLTAAQSGLPAHSHGITDPGHTHNQASRNSTVSGGWISGAFTGSRGVTIGTDSSTTGVSVDNSTAQSASEAHDNMPPYIVAYIWKRTA